MLSRPQQEHRLPQTAAATRQSRRRQRYRFIREFLISPRTVGAIAPSGRLLCRKMVQVADLGGARSVAEFGPGTGACTSEILPALPPGCRFFAVELSPRMTEAWRAAHPGATIYNQSVKDVAAICRREGVESLDTIFSGLPWASFGEPLQRELLAATVSVLRPGGVFVTFGYRMGMLLPAGRRFARILPEYFSKVERSRYIWRNLPPAFVLRCTR